MTTAKQVVASITDVIRNPRATWQYIKHEANHYWLGSKLLWSEIKLANSILSRVLQGHGMTRRERKQLIRTSMDLFRLVPFAIFVIVPFMEFLLPFALRLFPNMLPSTFQDSLKKEENMKKELQARLAVAGFMQETLQEMAAARKTKGAVGSKEEGKDDASGAKEVIDFIDKARLGEPLAKDSVIRIARLFKDELTLANIARPQLVSMCQYMGLPPYGADAFLRFQLRTKLTAIKEDDRRILWEGIDVLTIEELREACQERGMQAFDLTDFQYKRQLQEWLDLSIQKSIPISLLIMSRAFMISSTSLQMKPEDVLQSSMSSLDSDLVNEVVLAVAKPSEAALPEIQRRKLESLEFQQELIEDEREETEEAKQEMILSIAAKDRSSKEKGKEQAAQQAAQQALAAGAVEGYMRGAAGTGDEKAFADAPAASTVATAVMAAAMESNVNAAVQQSASASGSASGVDSSKAHSASLAAADAADNEAAAAAPLAPDLTLHELEAITDLARESVLEREKTELAHIKASIASASTAEDDDDEANARNIENKGDADTFQAVAAADRQDRKDKEAAAAVASTSISATVSAMASTMASASASSLSLSPSSSAPSGESAEGEDDEEDPNVARMRDALNSMVRKLESKISSTEKALGDKLDRVLDTDRDGEISLDEFKVRGRGERGDSGRRVNA